MRSGAMRGVITIQRKIQMGVTDHNAPDMVWQDWRTDVPVEIEVKRGREHYDPLTRQRFSEEVYRFRTRFENVRGIDATMQVVGSDATYDIKAILPNKQLEDEVVVECTVQDATLGDVVLMAYLAAMPPDGTEAVVYGGFTVSAKGGTTPYSFDLSSGTLPAGLLLNASTGAVTGTPTAAGTTSGLIFRVTDDAGDTAVLPTVSITIA